MASRSRRTGAAALAGAAVTGLIAFTLFLAGALLLWANAHYKDSGGYFCDRQRGFASDGYAITSDQLEVGAAGRAGWSEATATGRSA